MSAIRSGVRSLLLVLAACFGAPGLAVAQTPAASPEPAAAARPAEVPAPRPGYPAFVGVPLLLDRGDVGLGTTVHFDRIPTPNELHDLEYTYGLAHIVLSLREWPRTFEALQGLNRRDADVELIVILPGYPPSREAAQAWNLVGGPIRVVMLVGGPPPDRGVINDLNTMRSLERVIAQMDQPSRSGFERLQRPLSFRRIVP